MEWFLGGFTLLLGFYMAWNIGANDVANAMGTSVGSKALTLKKAVFLAAILEFSGAFFVGSEVSETIQKGIVDPTVFSSEPTLFILGMMGALLSTGVLLQIASYFGLPISTTHALVGAVLGFGLVIGGVDAIFWPKIGTIVASWIISPLLSGVISYTLFGLIQKKILYAISPIESTQKILPFLVFSCFFVIFIGLFYDGIPQFDIPLHPGAVVSLAATAGLIAFFFSHQSVKKISSPSLGVASGFHPAQSISLEKALHHLRRAHLSNRNESYADQFSSALDQIKDLAETVKKNTQFSHPHTQYHSVEKLFVFLQILSACLIAFAHGANDVANAIGPVAAVITALKTNSLSAQAETPSWLLALGGGGIVIGLATWGWRVIETIGQKITELTPTRGFSAEFGAAITILFASKLGLPISSTHALVGAVLGVGLNRGLQALNLKMIKEIVISWIVTIPLCAAMSIFCFYALKQSYSLIINYLH
ncbi:MAG: inorganic phosphate transporter [Chlamydiae bacterium]|nr:inorganic phosphate transporter [Chlamydiota bacterium]